MRNGDHVRVEGEFETERHKGPYTFYNDLEVTKISPLTHSSSNAQPLPFVKAHNGDTGWTFDVLTISEYIILES